MVTRGVHRFYYWPNPGEIHEMEIYQLPTKGEGAYQIILILKESLANYREYNKKCSCLFKDFQKT